MPGFGGIPGFRRFANRWMAGLITWLFPLAILGSIAAASRTRATWPVGREHLGLVIWGGWLATHWVVFSFAQGIHEYYTTVMGPAVAALAAIGAVALYEASTRGGWRTLLLPGVTLATAAWQAWIVNRHPGWRAWLLPTLLGGAALGSIGFVASRWLADRWPSLTWARVSAGVGLASLLVCPTLWSMITVMPPGVAILPTADPTLLNLKREGPTSSPTAGGGAGARLNSPAEATRRLVAFLKANRRDEPILVAGLSSVVVAPIIIATGEPAVSLGGFLGGDIVMSMDRFIELVEGGQLRFFLVNSGPGGGGPGSGPPRTPGGPGGVGGGPPDVRGNAAIVAWVREHGKPVDPKLWKLDDPAEASKAEPPPVGELPPDPARAPSGRLRRQVQVYDLRPELGLTPPSAG